MHEDPTHASAGPVCFQKTRQRRIVAGKAGRRSDAEFEFIPKGCKRWGPKGRGNGFPVVLTFKGAERLDADLKVGAVNIVKSE